MDVENTLHVSVNNGIDLDSMTLPADPKQEAKRLMEIFKATLALADMSPYNFVSVTVYYPDLFLYVDFIMVYRSCFKQDSPARAFIGARSLLFGIRFEMQGIAVK
jgi:2-iminobutanoate/2-iminopropanoate deaminase